MLSAPWKSDHGIYGTSVCYLKPPRPRPPPRFWPLSFLNPIEESGRRSQKSTMAISVIVNTQSIPYWARFRSTKPFGRSGPRNGGYQTTVVRTSAMKSPTSLAAVRFRSTLPGSMPLMAFEVRLVQGRPNEPSPRTQFTVYESPAACVSRCWTGLVADAPTIKEGFLDRKSGRAAGCHAARWARHTRPTLPMICAFTASRGPIVSCNAGGVSDPPHAFGFRLNINRLDECRVRSRGRRGWVRRTWRCCCRCGG